jgi:orotidine-5'-phosphate decarboxylase
MRNSIIAALDVPTAEQAVKLAKQIAWAVGAIKLGKKLIVDAGLDIVRRVRATGVSWLVIGRPIYAADNPPAAAESILSSLS